MSLERSTVESAEMLARSVARFTDTATTPGTALMAFSTRPTHEAQVMPSIGREIAADVMSAARTGAFIAVSFSLRIHVRTESGASSRGEVKECFTLFLGS